MEPGLIRKIDIDHEMQQAYLDYAMSVIVARALPDARDGLKPVQRRILFAMHDMGLRADSTYKKSARIVGEVLGKYHPHGDTAVYEAMARMAQTFSLRTLLVDGQGNFGSVDGDPPAAMRYTEARLAAPALEMLSDLNKDTVDFTANFDDTLQEPTVLPAALPNLLVNGATGIAVGMATSIPPHNLGELTEALTYMLERWDKLDEISVGDLMKFVHGPDFPTGGMIIEQSGTEGIEAAYGSGRGRITIQAKAHIEEMERGRSRIIVSELPYQVNKSTLIERIAELARGGTLEGLADLRDESDRQGLRIVIELSKSAAPDKVLADLFRRTQMETTFSIILLALVAGEPRLLTLKQALRVYLEHRLAVVKRRAEYDLQRAQQRAHILEGYLVALKHLDELIGLIRSAADVEAARAKIMKRYKLSEPQATAILDMQLRRLAALERKKIDVEYKEVSALIKDLEGLLKSSKRMRALAGEELRRISAAFADRRRTQIVHVKAGKSRKAMDVQESLPDQPIWVGIAANGRMARTHDDKPPKLTGADAPRFLVRLNTTDVLYLASVGGTAAAVSVNNIPESDKLADGVPFFKVSPLRDGDTLAAAFSLPARRALLPPEACLLTVTRAGLIKKTLVSELLGPSAQTFTLARVNEGDGLAATALTDGKKEVLLVTAMGMAIRFAESEVRPMGLVAAGVSGIRLDDKDRVIAVEILPATGEVLLLASDGKAKRVDQKEFPLQGRYGKGVNAWTLPKKVTLAGALTAKGSATVTVHLAKAAPKSTRLEAVGVRKRASTRGDRLVDVKPGDSVVAVTSGWMVERYVQFAKVEQPTKARKAVKASPAKRRSAGKPKRAPRSAPKKKAKARARRVAGKTAK